MLEQESVGGHALSLESYSSTAVHAVMNSQAVHVFTTNNHYCEQSEDVTLK